MRLVDRIGPDSPLRQREFMLLLSGQVISLVGTAIAPIALAFAVLDLTGSGTDLGIVVAAGWVPQIVFILAGGVWADRLPRHLVMVGSNALSGIAQLVVAGLLLTGNASVLTLAALQLVRGIATSFFFPASQGLVPQTVPQRVLQQANALMRMSRNATQIGGAAAGGLLVAVLGSGWAIAFDGATYLVSALVLLQMRVVASRIASGASFLLELREGWDEFRARSWVWAIVIGAGIGNAAMTGAMGVLGPIVAKDELGGAAAWGIVLAGTGIGLLLGGLLSLRVRPSRPLLIGCTALFLLAPPLLLLAYGAPTLAIAAAAVCSGVGVELFSVFWDTALQQHIPIERLSRVSSYDALGSFVLIPLGLIAAGPLADAIGVKESLLLASAIVVASVVLMLLVPGVRNLRRTELPVAAETAA